MHSATACTLHCCSARLVTGGTPKFFICKSIISDFGFEFEHFTVGAGSNPGEKKHGGFETGGCKPSRPKNCNASLTFFRGSQDLKWSKGCKAAKVRGLRGVCVCFCDKKAFPVHFRRLCLSTLPLTPHCIVCNTTYQSYFAPSTLLPSTSAFKHASRAAHRSSLGAKYMSLICLSPFTKDSRVLRYKTKIYFFLTGASLFELQIAFH